MTSPIAGVRHAGEMSLRTRRPRPAALRTRIACSIRRTAASASSRLLRRRCSCGIVARSIVAPSPPAKAISASATARPPSLRSWQARTRPAAIAACSAANVCFGQRAASTCGTLPAAKLVHQREMRAAQLVLRRADQVEQVARLLQIHRHARAHIVDLAHRADQQRRRNRDRSASCRRRRHSGIRCSGCPCR